MRIRTCENPQPRKTIDRIIREGAQRDDKRHFPQLLRRLQQACFLDSRGRPLLPRERLVEQYKNDGFVLFLGAGVSIESGIPAWPALATKVLQKSGVSARELANLKRALPSQIAQFELAGMRFGDSQKLLAAIYEGLYQGLKCKESLEQIPKKYEEQAKWDGWHRILGKLKVNKTLCAVGNLLFCSGGKLRRNPQIHAVVTSNADTLLELYCAAKAKGKRILTMVDRASVGEAPDTIPVHHIHGTLDARGENALRPSCARGPKDGFQDITPDLLPELVFRESEYYETIANPSSFVNHTPQSLLRSLNALFIGTSLDDLNMRRWLHGSFRERVRHRKKYLRELHFRKYEDAEHEARLESLRHFWIRPETETDNKGKKWDVPKDHVELVMRNLGVQVLWCHDFEEMRKCINDLSKFGADSQFGRRPAAAPR